MMYKSSSPQYSRRSLGMDQIEMDPYSPAIVHELLQGTNEWINIQDIVKLTFKAMFDVVKAQGEAIRDMERVIPTKASKSEVNSGLSLKANISDVSRTVAEVATNIESRATMEDVRSLVEDKISRSDLQYLLSNKVSIEELRSLLESKASVHEVRQEIKSITNRVEDLNLDSSSKFANAVTRKEFKDLEMQLQNKANLGDVNESLQTKANKQSVANALHRKANRADMDALFATKVEVSDFQKIFPALQSKVDASDFESLHNIISIKADKSDVKEIMHQLYSKAEKTDLDMYVSSGNTGKLENDQRISDIERQINNLLSNFHEDIQNINKTISDNLSKKADVSEVESTLNILKRKAEMDNVEAQLSEVRSNISNSLIQVKSDMLQMQKASDDAFDDKGRRNEYKADQAVEEVMKMREQLKNMIEERRNDIDETAKYVKTMTSAARQDIDQERVLLQKEMGIMQKDIEDMASRKVEKRDMLETKEKLINLLEPKVDLQEVQTAITGLQKDLAGRLAEIKDDVKREIRISEDQVFSELEKKPSMLEMEKQLSLKADERNLLMGMEEKANKTDVEVLRLKVEKEERDIGNKVEYHELENHIGHTKGAIEDMNKELLLKSNIKDVITLMDMKANIDDVNKALQEVHKDLDVKSPQEELTNALNDQALINEALCAENCVGRWIWKSGEVKHGHSIPWEIQSVNTCPDNFVWEKDESRILTVAPGLYEINMGFFAKKKPTVQLMVNGEPVLSAVNSASYVIHHSSGKIKNVGRHSAGNITGLTLIDFIALPARARLSISYSGEAGAEGFLGLRKL